jgi:hypothetical protein
MSFLSTQIFGQRSIEDSPLNDQKREGNGLMSGTIKKERKIDSALL